MELKEFVSQTLTDIIGGVIDAQNLTKDTGTIINPAMSGTSKFVGGVYMDRETTEQHHRSINIFDFDVAVTLSETDEAKGIIMVFSGFLSGGVQGTTSGESSEISRIKFSVPVVFPYQE